MNKFLYKMKNNKLFAALVIFVSLIILFDLCLIVYDVLQYIEIKGNSIVRFVGYSTINIIGTVLNIVAVLVVIAYVIYRRRKIKVQIKDDTKSH